MRHVPLAFLVAAAVSMTTLVGATGCTATGSSTIVAGGNEGGASGFEDGTESDGGTTTKKDAGTSEQVDDYDALFGPPSVTSTTPDSLKGLWAGAGPAGQDMRLRFGTSSIVIALRCGSSPAVGASIAASISSSTIKTLESKKVGNPATSCGISVTPDEISSCASASYPCFELKGTKLSLASFLDTSGTFTKLSD